MYIVIVFSKLETHLLSKDNNASVQRHKNDENSFKLKEKNHQTNIWFVAMITAIFLNKIMGFTIKIQTITEKVYSAN